MKQILILILLVLTVVSAQENENTQTESLDRKFRDVIYQMTFESLTADGTPEDEAKIQAAQSAQIQSKMLPQEMKQQIVNGEVRPELLGSMSFEINMGQENTVSKLLEVLKSKKLSKEAIEKQQSDLARMIDIAPEIASLNQDGLDDLLRQVLAARIKKQKPELSQMASLILANRMMRNKKISSTLLADQILNPEQDIIALPENVDFELSSNNMAKVVVKSNTDKYFEQTLIYQSTEDNNYFVLMGDDRFLELAIQSDESLLFVTSACISNILSIHMPSESLTAVVKHGEETYTFRPKLTKPIPDSSSVHSAKALATGLAQKLSLELTTEEQGTIQVDFSSSNLVAMYRNWFFLYKRVIISGTIFLAVFTMLIFFYVKKKMKNQAGPVAAE